MQGRREAICVKACYWLHHKWDRGESYWAAPGERIAETTKDMGENLIPCHFKWADDLEERPEESPIIKAEGGRNVVVSPAARVNKRTGRLIHA